MLISLTRAAQFAHISRRIIERELSQLYKDSARWADREHGSGAATDAVPNILLKLYRAGGPMYFDAYGTLVHFGYKYKLLCPLCFSLSTYGYAPLKLTTYVSPQYLRLDGERYHHSSICSSCYDSIARFRDHKPIENEADCLTGLCFLLGRSEAFRRRLAANKYRRVRFDPRDLLPRHGPLRILEPVKQLELRAEKPVPIRKAVLELPPPPKANKPRTRVSMWDALAAQQKRDHS